jgi:hypothetical protein
VASAATAPLQRRHRSAKVEDEDVARQGRDGEIVDRMDDLRGVEPAPRSA